MKLYINGKEYPCRAEDSVMDVLRRNDIPIAGPCGGKGTCGKCTVTVDGTEVLACRTAVKDGMNVSLSGKKEMTVLERGIEYRVDIINNAAETDLGIACDMGTTTVVCHLVHMSSGKRLNTVSGANAQAPWGADVISRIQAASDGQLGELNKAIISQINGFITDLCNKSGEKRENIKYMSSAGNTVMCHLFAGLSPQSIGKAPYIPLSLFGEVCDAHDLGLNIDAEVYITPSVSGYVGGDITAGVLACCMEEGISLLIDVGTNGEMVLCKDGKMLCCATAAGPAFEGAEICCGAPAQPGAVSAVSVKDGQLKLSVIGEETPFCICGSGLIDALAAMLELGAVDETGRLLEEDESEAPQYLKEVDGEDVFSLTEDGKVYITQKDIRKLQLAKAAVAAGIGVLLEEAGIEPDQVQSLMLAGGFGSRMDPVTAAEIGLIPRQLLPVTKAVGNAAGEGAVAALLSANARERLNEIKENMTYIELSTHKGFTDRFVDEMMFD